jgi:hypothetical protein
MTITLPDWIVDLMIRALTRHARRAADEAAEQARRDCAQAFDALRAELGDVVFDAEPWMREAMAAAAEAAFDSALSDK